MYEDKLNPEDKELVDILNKSEVTEDLVPLLKDVINYKNFLEVLKYSILDKNDYQEMQSKNKDTGEYEISGFFLKKSGYFKLRKAFKVRIELVDKQFIFNDKNKLTTAIFHVKGYYNNECIDAFGACDQVEGRKVKGTNDVVGTAHTRAMIRAIAQSVDFGSVGAEEIASLKDEFTQE